LQLSAICSNNDNITKDSILDITGLLQIVITNVSDTSQVL